MKVNLPLTKQFFPKLSVTMLITKWLRRKIEKRKHSHELIQKYGKWWTNVLVLIFLLGVVGAYNDGAVIFGMARAASTSFWKAILVAAFFAGIVQYCIGNNVAHWVESYLKKKKNKVYQSDGHKFMRKLFLFLIVAGLGFSLFLNTKSRLAASNLSSSPSLIDMDSIKLYYKQEMAIIDTTYQMDVDRLEQSHDAPIATLVKSASNYKKETAKTIKNYKKLNRQSDVAFVSQKMTLAGKNYGTQIAEVQFTKAEALQALLNSKNERIEKLEEERTAEITEAKTENDKITATHEANLTLFGFFIQALNWLANLGKVILVAAYHRFLFYAEAENKKEEDKLKKKVVLAHSIAPSMAHAATDQQAKPAENIKPETESGKNKPIVAAPPNLPQKRKSGKGKKAAQSKAAVQRAWQKLEKSGKVRQKDIAEITGLSVRTVRNYMKELREESNPA